MAHQATSHGTLVCRGTVVEKHWSGAGVGKLWPARSFYAACGHLQKYKLCSLVLTVEMAWVAKRLANEVLIGLFSGSLTAQFYLLFLIWLLTSRYQFLKSLSTFLFLLNEVERS